MFEPLQKFLLRASNHYNMTKIMSATKICHDFRTIIPEIFAGKETPEKFISPAHFQDGTLTVNATSPAWAQEIVMRKDKIIAELNLKAGRQVIQNLKTELKTELKSA